MGEAHPLISAGTIIEVDELHYAFRVGTPCRLGTLRLRVGNDVLALHPNLEWVRLVGTHLYPDSRELPVDVLVRVSRLYAALAGARAGQSSTGSRARAH